AMIDFASHKLEDAPGILVLQLTGNLDAQNSEYLMDCVQGHIEDGIDRIILNCAELDFISSVGLGTLIRAMTRLKKQGGTVALAGARGAVADVIRLVRLNRLANIYGNVAEAAAALKQQS
ncbi:MAG: STAS domain-containing protein, partial [Fuerstiella sp.]